MKEFDIEEHIQRLAYAKVQEGTDIPDAIRALVTQPIARDDRLRVLKQVWLSDIYRMSYETSKNMPYQNDDHIYRVSVCPDGVDVICFGLGVDTTHDAHYINVDVLPKWVQERLAVLMMMTYTPPTEEVEGVGRRISRDVYWVYKPDGVV
jgi:hypothetical protein